MAETITINNLLKKNFTTLDLSDKWLNILGKAEASFKCVIWGKSGHGKTTFVLQLIYELSRHGKVLFNSVEQGDSSSLKEQVLNAGLEDAPGTIVIGDRLPFDRLLKKAGSTRSRFVVIDSIQYQGLTIRQYKKFINTYPHKALILISWEGNAGKPKGVGTDFQFMADIKIHVREGVAYAMSRYGHTEPFVIIPNWDATKVPGYKPTEQ